MIPSDLFYIAIPLTNSAGNVLLKLSLFEREKGAWRWFLIMQSLGYATFLVVAVFSYLFLMSHDASLFVLIFSLNYLATVYVSRWFLEKKFLSKKIIYDILVVAGIVIFYWGFSFQSPITKVVEQSYK